MAKQIIILGTTQNATDTTVDCVFWYSITSGKKVTVTGSAWSGRSTAENNLILSGDVLEERKAISFPAGLNTTDMKSTLQARWTQRNAEIAGKGPALFGDVFWDGTTGWSA